MSAAAALRRARYRLAVERDLRRFRRRHAATFAGPGPGTATGGPTVLVVSLTSFPYQLKLEGILAKALDLHGLSPLVLVPDAPPGHGSNLPRRTFEALGVHRFGTLAGFGDPAAEARLEALARPLVAEGTSAQIDAFVFEGVPLGRYALSTASRVLHASRVDLDDPQVRPAVGRLLSAAIRSAVAGRRLIDTLRPALVLFNERNYANEAPLCDIALAHGANAVQWVGGIHDDGLVLKRYTEESKGMHPRSLSEASWERVRRLEWTPQRQAELDAEFAARYDHPTGLAGLNHGWTRRYRPEAILGQLGLDPAKRTAVLFSHILWDANMFFRGVDLFPDQEEWFVRTVQAACENDRVNWIVKLHPGNVWKLRREGFEGEAGELEVLRRQVGDLPPHVGLMRADSDVSARSVFDLASWGVTIRGSIGFELPCFGVPVLTAGTGFYSGRGFTADSASAEEYLARVRTIDRIPPLTEEQVCLARLHAYGLWRLRPTRFTSFTSVVAPLAELGHPLDHDLVVNLRSREELERAPDLRGFAAWAADSRELDYLDLP